MIDLEKAEQEFRAQIKVATDETMKAVAEGRAQASYDAAQEEFIEATVALHMAIMRLMNRGVSPDDIAGAVGAFIGGICVSVEQSFGDEQAAIMYEMADRTVTEMENEGGPENGAHAKYEAKND